MAHSTDIDRVIRLGDLLDTRTISDILGLSSPRSVSVLMSRHADFPRPVLAGGGALFWDRADIDAWALATGRQVHDPRRPDRKIVR